MKFKTKELEYLLEVVRNTEVMTDVVTKKNILGWLIDELELREKIGKNSSEAVKSKKDIA